MTIPKTISEDDKLHGISDVAKILKVHRSTVHYWIKNGMVKTERHGVYHAITRAEVKRLQKMFGQDAGK